MIEKDFIDITERLEKLNKEISDVIGAYKAIIPVPRLEAGKVYAAIRDGYTRIFKVTKSDDFGFTYESSLVIWKGDGSWQKEGWGATFPRNTNELEEYLEIGDNIKE